MMKLVGVQIPEELQIKEGIDHVRKVGKKRWRCNLCNLKRPNVETGQGRCHFFRIGNCILENDNSEINSQLTVDNLLNMNHNKMLWPRAVTHWGSSITCIIGTGTQSTAGIHILTRNQSRTLRSIKELENTSYNEWLKDLKWLSLSEQALRPELNTVFNTIIKENK